MHKKPLATVLCLGPQGGGGELTVLLQTPWLDLRRPLQDREGWAEMGKGGCRIIPTPPIRGSATGH